MINREFQPPKSWDDFESLCCDVWKVEWNCPSMQLNGREGQKQKGVDCYGKKKPSEHWTGIQCKRKQTYPEKKLEYQTVLDEVIKAKDFEPKLEHLIIATTFRRCSKLQEEVRKLSDKLQSEGLFSVSVAFWDDIERLLNKNDSVAKEYYKNYYSELSEEERRLFLIKNQTKVELLDLGLQAWLGGSGKYLTFTVKNVSEMPALSFSLRIFRKEGKDIELVKDSVNKFCFLDKLKVDPGKEQSYPLIAIDDLVRQFSDSFLNKRIVGAGLSPNIPDNLKDRIVNQSLKSVGHLDCFAVNHCFTTFPVFVKYKYSSPFGTETEHLTGAYIYLQEI